MKNTMSNELGKRADNMKYTEQLLKNPEYIKLQNEILVWERERVYCRHELSHALDVCRMAWIMYLEMYVGLGEDDTEVCPKPENQKRSGELEEIKDRIYVIGLLHDIGRVRQYQTGEHHAVAGKVIAEQILTEISYPEKWMKEDLPIIAKHTGRAYNSRTSEVETEKNRSLTGQMEYCICRADHLSRNCFCCEAAETCKWKEEERNRTILY